jgi:hypothetical protein
MRCSTKGAPALAFALIWHAITTALHTILPSQRDIPSSQVIHINYGALLYRVKFNILYLNIFTRSSIRHSFETHRPTSLTDNNIIEQLKIMHYTTSPRDTFHPFRVKANIAFAYKEVTPRFFVTFVPSILTALVDCQEHLRERANKAILTELNSYHLNDAASEATANALKLKANSPPVFSSPEIDDCDDGLGTLMI